MHVRLVLPVISSMGRMSSNISCEKGKQNVQKATSFIMPLYLLTFTQIIMMLFFIG
jgi:hypothetical protein